MGNPRMRRQRDSASIRRWTLVLGLATQLLRQQRHPCGARIQHPHQRRLFPGCGATRCPVSPCVPRPSGLLPSNSRIDSLFLQVGFSAQTHHRESSHSPSQIPSLITTPVLPHLRPHPKLLALLRLRPLLAFSLDLGARLRLANPPPRHPLLRRRLVAPLCPARPPLARTQLDLPRACCRPRRAAVGTDLLGRVRYRELAAMDRVHGWWGAGVQGAVAVVGGAGCAAGDGGRDDVVANNDEVS